MGTSARTPAVSKYIKRVMKEDGRVVIGNIDDNPVVLEYWHGTSGRIRVFNNGLVERFDFADEKWVKVFVIS